MNVLSTLAAIVLVAASGTVLADGSGESKGKGKGTDGAGKPAALEPIAVVDANGKVVGRYMRSDVAPLTDVRGLALITVNASLVALPLGGVADASKLTLRVPNQELLFATTNCSGTGYFFYQYLPGTVPALAIPDNAGNVRAYVASTTRVQPAQLPQMNSLYRAVDGCVAFPRAYIPDTPLFQVTSIFDLFTTYAEPLTLR